MIVMAGKFDRFAAKLDGFWGLKGYVGYQSIGIVHFLQELTDRIERNDLETFDILERCRPADVIFVRVRVDEHLDRLVGYVCNRGGNAPSVACRSIKHNDSIIGDKECRLPSVVGKDVYSPPTFLTA